MFNGLYPLITRLYSDDTSAVFRTEYGQERLPATIKIGLVETNVEADVETDDSASRLSNLRKVASLDHPHLIRVYDYGDGVFDDAFVLFVVNEYAEDNLAEVLQDRPLTEAETAEVAEAVSEALAYLHQRGLVCTGLTPSQIFAVDDQIKISNECIVPQDASANLSAAADLRSFGLLIVECLTQKTPEAGGLKEIASALPPRFRTLVENSLSDDPDERRAAFKDRQDETPEVTAAPKRAKAPVAAIAGAVVFLGAVGLYVMKPGPNAPAPAVSKSRTEIPAAPAPVERAAPMPAAVAPVQSLPLLRESKAGKGDQFVIVATYNRLEDARKRAKSIKSRWPQFAADVHSPTPNRPPYLVTIGANLSKEAAVHLQRKAIGAGLPRDTYFQSFRP